MSMTKHRQTRIVVCEERNNHGTPQYTHRLILVLSKPNLHFRNILIMDIPAMLHKVILPPEPFPANPMAAFKRTVYQYTRMLGEEVAVEGRLCLIALPTLHLSAEDPIRRVTCMRAAEMIC
jgi:hypothetical protein